MGPRPAAAAAFLLRLCWQIAAFEAKHSRPLVIEFKTRKGEEKGRERSIAWGQREKGDRTFVNLSKGEGCRQRRDDQVGKGVMCITASLASLI